jgi:Primase C terminal 2 (PriCT-2)/VirE N-terminal domain
VSFIMTQSAQQSQPPSILDQLVSGFVNVRQTVPQGNIPLQAVLAQIRDGTFSLDIARLRASKTQLTGKAYTAEKAKLQCFTPCCTLRTREKTVALADKLLTCTGIVHLDFDHIGDRAAAKAQLLKEPSLVFCFDSTSGDGLKAGLAATGIVDGDTYKQAWRHVVRLLEARYPGLEASRDDQVSYITALCYVSHDPRLFMNAQAVPIEVPPYVEPEPAPMPEKREGPGVAVVASALFTIPEYEDYKPWLRLGMALHATGQPWAKDLWDAWSQQSPKFDRAVQTAKWQGFQQGGNVQIDTLFAMARKYGWQDPGNTSPPDTKYLSANSTGLDKDSCGEEAPQVNSSQTSLYNEWPSIAEEAFHGVAGEIVRTIMPHTEADPVALLLQLLVYFGTVIGRQAHHMVGETRHHTNLSACLVGATSRGRKGSAFDFVQACVFPTDPAYFTWSYDNIIGGCGSGEGVIAAVRDAIVKPERVKENGQTPRYELVEVDPGVSDKRLLIYEAEFSSVLKVTNRETNLLSDVLRKFWETGTIRNTVKNAPLKTTDAHVSLIGHITSEELQKTLTSTEAANGFANRILWVCVRRRGRLPEGGSLDPQTLGALRAKLREAVRNTRPITALKRDEAARLAWDAVWDDLTEDRPGLVGGLLARAEGQVLRLSMIYALLDGSWTIGQDHLNAALALWQYVEKSVWYLFGTSLGDVAADTVLAALEQAKNGSLSRNHLAHPDLARPLSRRRAGPRAAPLAAPRTCNHFTEQDGSARASYRSHYTLTLRGLRGICPRLRFYK